MCVREGQRGTILLRTKQPPKQKQEFATIYLVFKRSKALEEELGECEIQLPLMCVHKVDLTIRVVEVGVLLCHHEKAPHTSVSEVKSH